MSIACKGLYCISANTELMSFIVRIALSRITGRLISSVTLVVSIAEDAKHRSGVCLFCPAISVLLSRRSNVVLASSAQTRPAYVSALLSEGRQ